MFVLLVCFDGDAEGDLNGKPGLHWMLEHPNVVDTEHVYEDHDEGLEKALAATYDVDHTFVSRKAALTYLRETLDTRLNFANEREILDFWLVPVSYDERHGCTLAKADDDGIMRTFIDNEFPLMTYCNNKWEINFSPIAVS